MKKQTKQPAPEITQAAAGTAQAISPETATILTLSPGGKRPSLMASVASENAQAALMKVQALQNARQRLAEAQDLYKAGSDKEQEASGIAQAAGVTLYQARADGIVSDNEINAALGDVFGYKPKNDGTPGKTPAGQGEGLRKRIVRVVKAHDYVATGDGGTFFDGLPVEDIQEVLDNVEAYGLYGAYQRFADIRKEHMTKVEMAFDPKRIAGLADKLSEDIATSAELFATNPALLAAYTALVEVIGNVDTAAANFAEAEAEAA